MTKFSELLEEYLTECDRQNSDYYDNRYLGERRDGRYRMEDIAAEMNEIFATLNNRIDTANLTGNE